MVARLPRNGHWIDLSEMIPLDFEPAMTPEGLPHELPLVGRESELDRLETHLRFEDTPYPATLFLRGDPGVGKTRLIRAALEPASTNGVRVFHGRASPLDSGLSYAVLADAFVPYLQDAEPTTLQTLTRGRLAELQSLFPAASQGGPRVELSAAGTPEDTRTTLFWSFSELLRGLARRGPIVVVVEDLQWADPASIQLLHFTIRRLQGRDVRFLCSSTEGLRSDNAALLEFETSLSSVGLGDALAVQPLDVDAIRRLVSASFDVPEEISAGFAGRLHEWSRGNPLFVTEMLRSLVESGDLYQRDGCWLGWEVDSFEPPTGLQDIVAIRLARLSPPARTLLEVAAAMGGGIDFQILGIVAGLGEVEALKGVDELRSRGILEEGKEALEFTHPLIRECVYGALGKPRRELLHRRIGDAIEAESSGRAVERAEELAYHFHRAGDQAAAGKAVEYLLIAGRRALDRHADEEAVRHLGAAMESMQARSSGTERTTPESKALIDYARALERVGRYEDAIRLWKRTIDSGSPGGGGVPKAELHRRLGLACFRSGRYSEALTHYGAGIRAAEEEPLLMGRIRLARGLCLQELARWDEANEDVESALALAIERNDANTRVRAHQALALHHLWTGRPATAREHAWTAIQEAEASSDPVGAFRSHWGLAVLDGLTGNLAEAQARIAETRRLAEALASPILRLWTEELVVQEAYARGTWDTAVALGEQAIEQARSLGRRSLLSRLLVWTALPVLGRGQLDRGRGLVEEACEVAGMDGSSPRPGAVDIHAVLPAFTGRVALHLGEGDFASAIVMGERGMEVAHRNGSAIWSIHHLVPLLAQAYMWTGELEGARRVGQRLRRDAERMDHRLGLAWAEACEALVTWLSGDIEAGSVRLEAAAATLDRIPMVYDAARIRRQLAGRFAELGRREEALDELRKAFVVFRDLGAKPELEKARGMFGELGERPPISGERPAVGELTGRELEVAVRVADRRSNKAIARELGISPRTVTTHLTNIYSKLELGSRGALVDLVREEGWGSDDRGVRDRRTR